MKNIISLAILCVSFISLIGCGHTAAATSSSDPSIAELIEQNRELQARVDALMTGAPATSGGATVTDGGAYTSGGPPLMTPVTGTTGSPTGAMMSCDGVDSFGMIMSGMLTETSAYGTGSRPWERTGASVGGLRHRVDYSGEFPIAIATNGRVVHEFVGGMPTSATMRMSGGGYCSMPVIPATVSDQYSPRNYQSYDFVWDEMVPTQQLEIVCLSGGSGRASSPFASWTISISMSSTSGYTRITGDMCREHMRGA